MSNALQHRQDLFNLNPFCTYPGADALLNDLWSLKNI